MGQKIYGDLDIIDGVVKLDGNELSGGIPYNTVTTNIAKLSLTGISAGDIYVITNEGNRIEQYLGGTVSNDANWAVFRNTVKLSLYLSSLWYSGLSPQFNGDYLPLDEWVLVGWVYDDTMYDFSDGLDPLPDILETFRIIAANGSDFMSAGDSCGATEYGDEMIGVYFLHIHSFPPRASVSLMVE